MFISNRDFKPISQKDIEKSKELENAICTQIQIAYDNAESAQAEKRRYHKRIDEIVKQLHDDDRMTYDLLYSYKKSFIAMFQGEGLSPVFTERDYFDKEITTKLNKIAEFDIESMKKSVKDVKMLSDIFDYWVWLRVYSGYDKINKCPVFVTPSPLSRYYDPNGSVLEEDFDYHIFHYQTSLHWLKYSNAIAWGYFDLDDVAVWEYSRSSEINDWKSQRLQNIAWVDDNTVFIYHCFITLNWHRYFCILANDQTKIIRWERLLPMTKEEKQDWTLVPFKITISNSSINAYDARWESYREKIYPVQVAITKLVNWMHSKQMRDLGHSINFYDIDRVDNPADLLVRPSGWPTFIPAQRLWEWPMVTPAFENNDTRQSQDYMKQLEVYAENTTSLTGIVRWLAPETGTLWETEIQMQKSNALFSVDAGTLLYGERMFWVNIYYRSFKENLPSIRKKSITLWFDSNDIIVIENTDLIWFNTPNITVKSKRKEAEERNRTAMTMQAMLPLMMQDQSIPKISKTLFKRELYAKQWLWESFILSIDPISPSERHAMEMQEIINMWEKPKNLIMPWLDLQTLWIYIQSCIENDVKQEVLAILNMKMIEEWLWQEQQMQQWWVWWVANSMWAQALSADIAQRQQALPSNW